MYWADRNKSYSYKIIGNDVIVEFDSNEWRMVNISIINDTLNYHESGMPKFTIRAIRVKEK
jgi:hypothetical protein